jgi:hypothetical protein
MLVEFHFNPSKELKMKKALFVIALTTSLTAGAATVNTQHSAGHNSFADAFAGNPPLAEKPPQWNCDSKAELDHFEWDVENARIELLGEKEETFIVHSRVPKKALTQTRTKDGGCIQERFP